MLRNFLLPESIARADGTGPEFELGPNRGKLLVLTLGITRIIEKAWMSPSGARPMEKTGV